MHQLSAAGSARAWCGVRIIWRSHVVTASSTAAAVLPASVIFFPPPSMRPPSAVQCALRHCSTKLPSSGQPQRRPASSAAVCDDDVVLYAPWEVRAMVLPLLPTELVPTGHGAATRTGTRELRNRPAQVHQQLPRTLRQFLEREYRLKSRTDGGQPSVGTPQPGEQPALTQYMLCHFPKEVVLLPSGHLALRAPYAPAGPCEASTSGVGAAPTSTNMPLASDDAALPSTGSTATPLDGSQAAGSFPADPAQQASAHNTAPPPPQHSLRSSTSRLPASLCTAATHAERIAPPPPPMPPGNSWRHSSGGKVAAVAGGGLMAPRAHFGGACAPNASPGSADAAPAEAGEPESGTPVPLRSTLQVMEALVPYIPTVFVSIEAIEPTLPSEIQRLYAETTFRFYLKRFRHYIDMRHSHGSLEIRLRPDYDHPQRGHADARFAVGGFSGVDGMQSGAPLLRRPPRNSEANLIGLVAPQVPREYTPLADVLQDIAPIISRHPAFDPRLGVTGLLGKYPEYFQMSQGKLRARPYRVAPNSLDDRDASTSPLPSIFTKVLAVVTEAAAGKNYGVAEEKASAAVSTGHLYSLLTQAEKTQVKTQCRSFPTFLRMHGKEIVVSADKMKVYRFLPEYEACVDTLMDERLRMNSLRPDDPVLKIPREMAPESNADWAVRALYDALPLMQCAELDEVLSLVPPAVRDALPRDLAAVQAVLESYPEYFTTWPYPDDPSVIVVQRAKVEQPNLEKADIVRMVLPLIPQGGTTLASLRTRVPLALQRYFSRHGTVATLGAMTDVFAISGDRIVRLV
ncbi:conserved hypothetical protein [Leishmania mexicana MHOM/GT/2001/U1103]|uniref:Uncharacterized protein n=1 Tax=Leishmania mexicana (strain MHOM/GT/2001/U1103) TaxID=929439 RepID=E9AZY6_LEIMU|nr:conserved hypothetical protein [Leishmania mexicana MHOM/GT/2001/U1103]CBZ28537.1 conserved hypothetical protein [Leishmania mexicana MHOM/GT/2001/U1103]